jgi:hypothetical protein
MPMELLEVKCYKRRAIGCLATLNKDEQGFTPLLLQQTASVLLGGCLDRYRFHGSS